MIENQYFIIQTSLNQHSHLDQLNQQFTQAYKNKNHLIKSQSKQLSQSKKSNSKSTIKGKSRDKQTKNYQLNTLNICFLRSSQSNILSQSQIKENSLLQKQSFQIHHFPTNESRAIKSKVNQQYFGIEDKEVLTSQQFNLKVAQKNKRCLSQIKSSKLNKKQIVSQTVLQNNQSKFINLPPIKKIQPYKRIFSNPKYLPIINRPNSPYHQTNSPIKQKSSNTNRQKSVKSNKQVIKTTKYIKSQQQCSKVQIQQQIDNLNETLTQIKVLNSMQQRSSKLLADHLKFASSLININYHNLLSARDKNHA